MQMFRNNEFPTTTRILPAVVIAADTVVEVDNLTLEKPGDEEDSARMIRMLSGYLLLLKYCVCMYVCTCIRS